MNHCTIRLFIGTIGLTFLVASCSTPKSASASDDAGAAPPPGFKALFNGKDLAGWWGADTEDPAKYMALPQEQLAKKQAKSREDIRRHWSVSNGKLINDGKGLFLTSDEFFGDFELF